MIRSALDSAASGLTAASTAVEVSATNVANTLTEDYTPLKASMSDADGGGVRVTVSRDAREGRGTDLIEETVGQIRAVRVYEANLASLKTSDEVNGVLVHLGQTRGG